jgi:hypothetical protein
MTDLPADVQKDYSELSGSGKWPPRAKNAFLETVTWFRDIDEGPA